MAYHHTAPAAMPATAPPNHDAARAQRSKQVQYIEERLRNGISPTAVARISAPLGQVETQPTLPSLAASIVADVAGYKRTMTCRNGVWDGYVLTHHLLHDRSTVVRGPSVHTAIEQEATLRIPIANVPMPQPLPPAHMMIEPQAQVPPQSPPQPIYLPNVQPVALPLVHTVPYASASAAQAPHMILSSTSQQELQGSSPMSSARVQSAQSSAPSSARNSVTAPDMSHRTPSEQAVIQALQVVANYPESRDFLETVSRRLSGLQSLLDAPVQLEGCLITRGNKGRSPNPNTPSTSATTPRAPSPIPGLSPVSDEELGRKRASPLELSRSASTRDRPTSRPPPDKRNNVLPSVVIKEPPKVATNGHE